MTDRLAKTLSIAEQAGKMIMSHFDTDVSVQIKSDRTPVTIADQEAEAFIRKELQAAFPGEAILGEEEGLTGSGDSRWVIDPIDGTKSFICGVPLFGTLIAFEQDGVPTLGIANFPALSLTYYAEVGQGAFRNSKPCKVSTTSDLKQAVICCAGHKGIEKAGLAQSINHLSHEVLATRTWCDAYGHCMVASGHVEAMIDPALSRWDVSALIPILSEAGGLATDLQGKGPLANETSRYQLISTNLALHEVLMERLRS